MAGLHTLVDLADKFGVIESVKAKLLKQPDPAADKLVTALDEISKIYKSLDVEMSRYLSVYFDDSQTPDQHAAERSSLVELEGGEVVARMGKARGHCKKILNIYSRYLSPWFDKVKSLSSDERDKLNQLFVELDEFDGHMIKAIDDIATQLSDEAHDTLDLVDASRLDEARQRIINYRKTVFPKRRAISEAMRTLLNLQADFIGVSGAL